MPALSLAAALDSSAPQSASSVLNAIRQWLLDNADPRRLIDTEAERKQIETDAVAAFDKYAKPVLIQKLGEVTGAAAAGVIEHELAKLLDLLFIALADTLPAAPVPTPAPAPTQGSAP